MKLHEIDNLFEGNILTALGLIGGAYAGSQLRRAVNDRLPTYKKGGLRRSTSQICRKVNGRQVCDYGANVGFDLPTIEPPRASGGSSRGRQPTIDLLNISTANNRHQDNRHQDNRRQDSAPEIHNNTQPSWGGTRARRKR